MDAPGPLGFITKAERTPQQERAHERALAMMPRLGLQPPPLKVGGRVCLFNAWRDPAVVADVGLTFNRFRQVTGSCVGAGGGNALFSLGAMQRLLSAGPTKALLPWWPFDYGKSRLRLGDHSPGEGSLGSTFAAAVRLDGVFDASQQGLPTFDASDGLALTRQQELAWSDGDSPTVSKWDSLARTHLVGATAEITDVVGVRAALLNGYPVTFACNNFIGSAHVQGSGADAAVVGSWDGRGGHQQSLHAVWDNPTLGPLYWAQNNWDGNTYPTDPAGGPVCGCWVTEAKVTEAFRLDAEVYAFSALNWFPAQPKVIDWALA